MRKCFKSIYTFINRVLFICLVERLQNLRPGELAEELSGQFEGDIILSDDQWKALNLADRNGLIDTTYRWQDRIVPFEYSDDVTEDQREFIRSALDEPEQISCLRFVDRTNEDDYVRVQVQHTLLYHITFNVKLIINF